jgi:hypothetical protein
MGIIINFGKKNFQMGLNLKDLIIIDLKKLIFIYGIKIIELYRSALIIW